MPAATGACALQAARWSGAVADAGRILLRSPSLALTRSIHGTDAGEARDCSRFLVFKTGTGVHI